MKESQVTLINRLGLHARAAAKLVNLSKSFASQVSLTKDGNTVDGKSIMNVLLLAAPVDTVLELKVEGEDEQVAFEAIVALIEDRFGEDE
ncbi:MAG: HPr family phosphocarrier protein [Gammaproteobacteria bacterium]|nr:HPr family phosphocarrier protein [Gammaproteobacteria bacterium]